MTLYSALTVEQKEQACHDLFINDALFDFDPAEFDYELDAAGVITGRCPLTAAPKVRRKQIRNQPVVLESLVMADCDQDVRYRMDCAINDLARAVALKLAEMESVSCHS
jgi:hypothetical protein